MLGYIVNWPYVYICPLPLEPPSSPPPHPSTSSQHRAEPPVLYGSIPLVIYLTHGCVCISVLLSQLAPPLLPPLCPQARSLHLCLYSCPANRFIYTIFLDSIYIYALIYAILLFSFWLHSVWQTLGSSASLSSFSWVIVKAHIKWTLTQWPVLNGE